MAFALLRPRRSLRQRRHLRAIVRRGVRGRGLRHAG
jgi:hypothetical protein